MAGDHGRVASGLGRIRFLIALAELRATTTATLYSNSRLTVAASRRSLSATASDMARVAALAALAMPPCTSCTTGQKGYPAS